MNATRQGIFERAGGALGALVVRHPRTAIVVSALVFAVFAVGALFARFSTDYRIFFSAQDPNLAAFQQLEKVFTKTDNVLFVVKAREGSIFAPEPLEAIQELTAAGWQLPYASRVDSLTTFPRVDASDDDITVADLVPGPARLLGAADLARIREAATREPLLVGSLLSKDGTTAGVNVTLRLPGKEPTEVAESAEAARGVVRRVQARHPAVEIRASGMAFINDAFMQASVRDMAVMMPIMIVVMLLAIVVVTRSAWATGAIAAVIGSSAVMTMAFAGWLRYPLTPPSVAAPVIVVTVAIADGVHIVLSTREAMRDGMSRALAAARAIRANFEAITYTWLTTVVGFVCLNYSDAPPVKHLANMTAFGVTVAFAYSFTLLPALLAVLPLAPARAAAEGADEHSLFGRLSDFVVRHRAPILVAAAAVTLAGGWLASTLETNDQFVQYFDRSIPFRRDADFTMKNLSGIYRLEFPIGAGGASKVTEPEYLDKLDGFAEWLRAQPEVEHVYSIVDIVKRVNEVVTGGGAASYAIPRTHEAVSQELVLYEMGLPHGADLTDRVSVDRSASRVTVTVKDLSSRAMNELGARSARWLRANAPPSMWSEPTGPVVIFSQLGDRNARSMVQGDFVSLALISLCMIVVLRSFKLGLLSVVPNVVPIIVGYGLWRVFVGHMNIVASVAASISLGIIVDDTIHFLTKYKACCRELGLVPEAAMRRTLCHVGPAMIGTSAILVLGFGVLTLSSFQMTSYLGWLSVLIIGVAPFADLVLAPALVGTFSRASAAASSSVAPDALGNLTVHTSSTGVT